MEVANTKETARNRAFYTLKSHDSLAVSRRISGALRRISGALRRISGALRRISGAFPAHFANSHPSLK
jgi:hypothetical protein